MENTFSGERELILKTYNLALQNWQDMNPGANPMKGIPDEMGMPRGSFYRKLRRGFEDGEQLRLFRVCLFPQGYHRLAVLLRDSIQRGKS